MGEELKKLEDYVKNHPELNFQDHDFVLLGYDYSQRTEAGMAQEVFHGIAVAPEARQVLLVAGDTRILLPFSSIHSVDFKGEAAVLKPDRIAQWIIAAVGVAIWIFLGFAFSDFNASIFAFAVLGSLVLSATMVGMLTVQQRVEETDTRTASLRIGTNDFENPVIEVVFCSNPDLNYSDMSESERMEAARKWYGRLKAIISGQGDADWTFKHHPRVDWKAFP